MITIVLFLFVFTTLYIYLTWNFTYWKKRNVIGPKPKPFLGTFPKSAVFLRNVLYDIDDIYRKYRGKTSIVGIYVNRTPQLLVVDPALAKDIFVSKFKYFPNNDTNYNKKNAKLFFRNPFILKDAEWKENRADLSPGFTIPKTKSLFPIIQNACKNLTKYLRKTGENNSEFPDTKDITSRFTADVVYNCIYGIEANAFEPTQSSFVEVARDIFRPSSLKLLYITLKSIFPYMFQFVDLPFVSHDVTEFFVNLTNDAINLRNKSIEGRKDFLDFLLKLQERKKLNIDDMAAHTITFFLDGYETSSIVLSHALYQLSKHHDCQQRLRDEIISYGDDINYETITDMPYLDQILNETLRISPPGFLIYKVCGEDTNLVNHDGKAIKIEKGTVLQIPMYSIHNDHKYFPNPSEFNPERFDPVHGQDPKTLRDMGLFAPFGMGPRICIGMRFSILQIKAAIVEIVNNFKISLNLRTPDPLLVTPKNYLYLPVNNIFLDYKPL